MQSSSRKLVTNFHYITYDCSRKLVTNFHYLDCSQEQCKAVQTMKRKSEAVTATTAMSSFHGYVQGKAGEEKTTVASTTASRATAWRCSLRRCGRRLLLELLLSILWDKQLLLRSKGAQCPAATPRPRRRKDPQFRRYRRWNCVSVRRRTCSAQENSFTFSFLPPGP